MFPFIIIVIVILVLLSIFLLEDVLGFDKIMKLLSLLIIVIVSGGGIYYCYNNMIKSTEEPECPNNNHHADYNEIVVKKKYGGIGIGNLCNDNGNDDKFHRIATDNDVDVKAYNENNQMYNIFNDSSNADEQITVRSQFNAGKDKQAVINRSRYNVNSIKKYFEDELSANENKVWWDDNELDAFT